MGYQSTAPQFRARIGRLARDLEFEERVKITRQMAEKGQDIADRYARRDLGTDGAFSGWRPGGLDTVVKQLRSGDHMLMPADRLAAAKWTVADFGRHADGGVGRFQGPGVNMRTGRTGRIRMRADGSTIVRRRTAGIRWNGVTQPMHTARDATRQMERDVQKVAEAGLQRAVRKHFDMT